MKKFLLKAIIFLILIFGFVEIFNYGYLSSDPFETKKFKKIPKEIGICNMGASHSEYSFNYVDLSGEYTTFNFGLSSQSHTYDYIVLDYYKRQIKEGGIVFLVVSFPMLLGVDEVETETFDVLNRRYYTFLPPKKIKQYDFTTDLKVKCFPFTFSGKVKPVLKGIFIDESKLWERKTDKEEVEKDVKEAYIRHIIKDRLDEQGNRIYNEESIRAIYDMVELCYDNGFIPIIITPPFTSEYVHEIKIGAPDYYERFYEIIGEIQNETGVEYYDYSQDERFLEKYDLFMNSDHLNKEGAKVFTDIVMKEVVNGRLEGEESVSK